MGKTYSEEEIKKFATECARINTDMWNLIGSCEELLNMPITKEFRNGSVDAGLMKEIYKHFSEVAEDEQAISCDLHSATLADASFLIETIIESEGK